jgi:hypothetical protein
MLPISLSVSPAAVPRFSSAVPVIPLLHSVALGSVSTEHALLASLYAASGHAVVELDHQQ